MNVSLLPQLDHSQDSGIAIGSFVLDFVGAAVSFLRLVNIQGHGNKLAQFFAVGEYSRSREWTCVHDFGGVGA